MKVNEVKKDNDFFSKSFKLLIIIFITTFLLEFFGSRNYSISLFNRIQNIDIEIIGLIISIILLIPEFDEVLENFNKDISIKRNKKQYIEYIYHSKVIEESKSSEIKQLLNKSKKNKSGCKESIDFIFKYEEQKLKERKINIAKRGSTMLIIFIFIVIKYKYSQLTVNSKTFSVVFLYSLLHTSIIFSILAFGNSIIYRLSDEKND